MRERSITNRIKIKMKLLDFVTFFDGISVQIIFTLLLDEI